MTQVGEIPLTVKDASGKVLYQTSVTVPKPQVLLKTSAGDVTLELDPVAAPITVNNFLAYVKSGYYESTLFHRVIAGFAVQGGGYTTGLVKKPGQLAQITLESNKGLSNLRGTVAMARTSVPNSAASEFFVNVVTNTFLDYQSAASPGYAVFGTVIQGLDVIDAIAVKPTGSFLGVPDVPLTDVTINAASQVK
jgi:cyclophilin family peptidyl-prolyl cis-trans isomerase